MKKEVFIAIFLGITIGLIITFGIRIAQKAVSTDKPSSLPNSATLTTPSPTTSSKNPLTITSPNTGAIVESDSIEIRGNTNPGVFVSAVSQTNQSSIVSDQMGNFVLLVNLESGPNTFTVTVHQLDGTTVEQIIDIVYSTADLEESNPTPSPTINEATKKE